MIESKKLQGSTNLIFKFTDFGVLEMVFLRTFMHTKLRVHKTVTVGANLHCLIYNVLIDIVFPVYFTII